MPPISAKEETKEIKLSIFSEKSNATDSKTFFLNVIRRSGIFISSFYLQREVFKPNETVVASLSVSNLDEQSHSIVLLFKLKKNGLVLKTQEIKKTIKPKSSLVVEWRYGLDEYQPPGEYKIEAFLMNSFRRVLDSREKSFVVEKVKKVVKTKNVSYGFFEHRVIIYVKNVGNVALKNYTIEEYAPKFLKEFFYPETEPSSMRIEENKFVVRWVLEELSPGEDFRIEYRVKYMNIVVIGLMLIGLVMIALSSTLRPKIEKTFKFKTEKEDKFIVVSLNVKNKSTRPIHNVVVTDIVPPIAKVVKDFEVLTPSIKTTDRGTKLVWKLGTLAPKEERIIVYKIKPTIHVIGGFTLPHATMTYTTKRGKKKGSVSKKVRVVYEIEGKV